MSTNFKKSYIEEHKFVGTYLNTEGFCYEVYGVNVVGDIEAFTKIYILQRKQLWSDQGWNGGVWSEENDIGYQNFMNTISHGKYEMEYYEKKFFNRVPAKIKCCNKWLSLGKFTNTCERCKADYNSGGQLLADRRFWGEETGEHWSDCL